MSVDNILIVAVCILGGLLVFCVFMAFMAMLDSFEDIEAGAAATAAPAVMFGTVGSL